MFKALSCGVLALFSISFSLASSLPSPLSSLITLLTFFSLSLTPPLLVDPSMTEAGKDEVQEAVFPTAIRSSPPSLEVTTVFTDMAPYSSMEDPGSMAKGQGKFCSIGWNLRITCVFKLTSYVKIQNL